MVRNNVCLAFAKALALGLVALNAAPAQAQELYVSPQQDVMSRMSSNVANMTVKDVIGDSINHQTGDLSFRHIDVLLKGHGPDITISRSFQVSARSAWNWRHDREFADWDLEIPSISTSTTLGSNDWKVVGSNPTARCTNFGPAANIGSYTANYWWQGVQLNIPGLPRQELMTRAAQNTYLPQVTIDGTLRTFNVVTRDNWVLTCLPTLKDGVAGEGFLAISPEGTKYWFDKMAYKFESYESDQSFTNLMRTTKWRASLYVTRVEDRLGNSLTYTYQNDRLSTITSNDGRALQVFWSANRGNGLGPAYHIERIVTQPDTPQARTWTYTYLYRGVQTGTNVMPRWDLNTVMLPDASSWSFNIGPFSNSCYDNRDAPGCTWQAPNGIYGAIKSPSGLTGTFKLKNGVANRAGQYAVVPPTTPYANASAQLREMDPMNIDAPRVMEKKLTGPGVDYTWTYSYGSKVIQTGGLANARMQTVNPDGSLENMYVDSAWGSPTEGQPVRYEKFNGPVAYNAIDGYSGNGVAVLVESYTYKQTLNRIGTIPRGNSNALGDEYRWPLKKHTKELDGVTFTTDMLAFDSLDRQVTIQRLNSAGYSRTDEVAYHDDPVLWAIGQQKSLKTNNVEVNRVEFGWKALPWKIYSYGRLRETRAYDTTSALSTNQLGTLKTITDGEGNVTSYSNWSRGIPGFTRFPASPEAPSGATKTLTIDGNGLITAITDESGATTGYGYDLMGRLASIQQPTGDSTVWHNTTLSFQPVNSVEYGIAAGHWKQVITTGATRTEKYFDGLMRPLLSREYDNSDAARIAATQRFQVRSFDYEGNATFVSFAGASNTNSLGTTNVYDAAGRLVRQSYTSELVTGANPTGRVDVLTEYLTGLKTRITAPSGQQTTTTYMMYDEPSWDWPVAITHPEGAFTDISRDVYGKPLSITRRNAAGSLTQSRRYVYRPDYQTLCKTIEPESGALLQDYNASGNLLWTFHSTTLTSTTDCSLGSVPASGRIVRAYDARNRLQSITYPDGAGDQIWSYTPDNLPAQVMTYNSLGSTSPIINSYTYNKRRKLTGESQGTKSIGYGYNSHGSLASQTYPSGLVVNYSPNALGQPSEIRDSAGNAFVSAVTYAPDGSIKQFTYGNGIQRVMTNNARQLPGRITDSYSGAFTMDFGYTYDGAGSIASIVDHLGTGRQSRAMTYDGLQRLKTATSPMFGTATYSYDPLDNLTAQTVTGGSSARTYTYVYEASTNRLTGIQDAGGATIVGLSYDTRGNLINKNGVLHNFDAGGKLRSVTGKEVEYLYDAYGRRVSAASGYMNPRFRNFVYSMSGQLLSSEVSASSATDNIYLSGTHVASRKVLFGIPNAAPTVNYKHADASGTAVVTTDANRAVVSTGEYEPYGQLVNRTAVNEIGYSGHMQDASTGLTYMQQRYYDPLIGRFISVDPVSADTAFGANFNRYAYASNNPYKYVDPDGRNAYYFVDAKILVIPVYFTGVDARPENIRLIQERMSSITVEFGAFKVVVLPKDRPDEPNTNTLTLAPHPDWSYGHAGEGINYFGGNKIHINTANADWIGGAVHDLMHAAGPIDGYIEGARVDGQRTSRPAPGYSEKHIMRSRSGIYLHPNDIKKIEENDTTIKDNLQKHIQREKETNSE